MNHKYVLNYTPRMQINCELLCNFPEKSIFTVTNFCFNHVCIKHNAAYTQQIMCTRHVLCGRNLHIGSHACAVFQNVSTTSIHLPRPAVKIISIVIISVNFQCRATLHMLHTLFCHRFAGNIKRIVSTF